MPEVIDLRSDTVTLPTPDMRQVIAAAEVGDDVFEDDPTVKRLEQKTAEILGQEKALFVPSGTMANQISLRTLCNPGDEVICERGTHIVNFEVAAAPALSGIMLSPYDGRKGRLDVQLIENAVRPPNIHHPITRVIALENTHNRAGGIVLDLEYIARVKEIARENSLSFYLDGARVWNAAIALGVKPGDIARHFDMVSVCFSKGLGAPIGSAVCGSAELIKKARRIRKMFGGGMRQVGIIASAALYALENNYSRLKEDHVNAKRLADGIKNIDGISIDINDIQTNIVAFELKMPVEKFIADARAKGLLVVPFGKNRVRAVPHLGIDESDISKAIEIITEVVSAN
jgi:threonine aldolase